MKPQIVIGFNLVEATDAAMETLRERSDLFQRGGVIVEAIKPANDPTELRIRDIPYPRLREILSEQADFFRVTKKGGTEQTTVPADVSLSLQARGDWPCLRPLQGTIDYPILTADGRILTTPGYDPSTRLILRGDLAVNVPVAPGWDDAQRALQDLLAVVAEFPWHDDIAKSAWLAALLTPLARPAFVGACPGFLVQANARGAGKGLVASVISTIVRGVPLDPKALPSDEEEVRKTIFAVARGGESLVLFDNVVNVLRSPSLDVALTAESKISGRVLGVSEIQDCPWVATLYFTANAASTSSDQTRRLLPITLRTKVERQERETFSVTNLLDYVRAERRRLLSAALIILRAFHVAGRPHQQMAPMGSYPAWSEFVRAPLIWLGMPDPAIAQDQQRERLDIERNDNLDLLKAIRTAFPDRRFTSKDLLFQAQINADLRHELNGLGEGGRPPNGKRLNMQFRRLEDQLVGGLSLRCHGRSSQGVEWSVIETSELQV